MEVRALRRIVDDAESPFRSIGETKPYKPELTDADLDRMLELRREREAEDERMVDEDRLR